MKVSNKLRRAILNAISAGTLESIRTHLPDCIENPPDTWSKEQTAAYDLINDVESKVARAVEKILLV